MAGKKSSSKNKKKINKNKNDGVVNDDIEDERFIAASNRPQFKKSGKKDEKGAGGALLGFDDHKIEIDERFASVLTDPRFRVDGDGIADKYGRDKKTNKKIKGKNGAEAELSAFYKIKKADDNEDGKEEKDDHSSPSDDDNDLEAPSLGDNSSDEDDEEKKNSSDDEKDMASGKGEEVPNDPESRIAYLTALSRGEISDSSSDDDTSSDDNDDSSVGSSDSDDSSEDSVYGKAGVLDPSTRAAEEEQIEVTFEPSPYLAVCNLDWTNIRAVDIMAVLSSFSPPGSVKCVTIFPSDFGLEQLQKEQIMGPQGIWKKNSVKKQKDDETDSDDNDNDDSDNSGEKSESEVESDHDTEDEDDDNLSASDDSLTGGEISEKYDSFVSESNRNEDGETDFDPEKLRAYESSKLKYYFAVAEFATAEAADAAYKEVDGMEIGHSSSSFDLRSIPPSALHGVVEGRNTRDKVITIPSNYLPPDFVVSALQQSSVKCTWDEGDSERQRALTQYGIGNETWAAMTEGDDLKAYLASDESDDSDDSSTQKGAKGSKMRKLLGLESDDESDGGHDKSQNYDSDDSNDSDMDGNNDESGKQATYFPGKSDLEQKIRSKLDSKKSDESPPTELSPWEKFQLKRKEKRKERRNEAKNKKNAYKKSDENHSDEDSESVPNNEDDDFLLEDKDTSNKSKKKSSKNLDVEESSKKQSKKPSTKEELSLLLSGKNENEKIKDFDMRGILRVEKNKEKKLKGSRKRKEAKYAENVSGTDFEINTKDDRFAAVLDGSDDRFGIDRTDPSYKETKGMQELMTEQSRRRRDRKRAKTSTHTATDFVVADGSKDMSSSSGALALSSLVKSLKSKVKK